MEFDSLIAKILIKFDRLFEDSILLPDCFKENGALVPGRAGGGWSSDSSEDEEQALEQFNRKMDDDTKHSDITEESRVVRNAPLKTFHSSSS